MRPYGKSAENVYEIGQTLTIQQFAPQFHASEYVLAWRGYKCYTERVSAFPVGRFRRWEGGEDRSYDRR
jgi:hypothetical protein